MSVVRGRYARTDAQSMRAAVSRNLFGHAVQHLVVLASVLATTLSNPTNSAQLDHTPDLFRPLVPLSRFQNPTALPYLLAIVKQPRAPSAARQRKQFHQSPCCPR